MKAVIFPTLIVFETVLIMSHSDSSQESEIYLKKNMMLSNLIILNTF